jgi:hypothetical protein
MNIIKTTLYFLAVILLSGCTYSVFSNQLPHLKDIYILPIENASGEADLETTMFNTISSEFISDGRLKIVSQEPDCELECKILDYSNSIYTYDEANNVKEYQVKILFAITFTDLNKNEVILTRPSLLKTEKYPADINNPDYVDSDVKSEATAQTEIFKDLFKEIMSNTLEAW